MLQFHCLTKRSTILLLCSMIAIAFIVACGANCFLFIHHLDLITYFGFMIVFSEASMAISILFGYLFGLQKVKALRQKKPNV